MLAPRHPNIQPARPETRMAETFSLPSSTKTSDTRRHRPASALETPRGLDTCPHETRIDGPNFANCGQCGVYLPSSPELQALRLPKHKFCFEVGMHEVLRKLEAIQGNCRPYDVSKTCYLRYRRTLVDWMCEVGDQIKIQASTVHHAVACMDTYFSKVRDMKRSEETKTFLQLVGYTCIFFSAKYCEKDSRGPTAHDISYLSQNTFRERQIIKSETDVLQTIGWELLLATPIDFVKVYLSLGCVFSNDKVPSTEYHQKTTSPTSKTLEYIQKYSDFFVDLCLQEYDFQKYSSHEMAVAIILCARKCVRMSPVWNPELETLTGMPYSKVELIFKKIFAFYRKSFPSTQPSRPQTSRNS